jgi:hypothetical protein
LQNAYVEEWEHVGVISAPPMTNRVGAPKDNTDCNEATMFLMHIEHHRVTKKDSAGELVARIADALEGFGLGDVPVQLFCDEHSGRKRSAVLAAVNKIPALAPLQMPPGNQGRKYRLSNLDTTWRDCVRPTAREVVTQASARALAAGVARSFPFNYAHFHFTPIPLLALDGPVPDPSERREILAWQDCLAPGIYLGTQWWVSGRMGALMAVVHRPAPPLDAKKIPPLTGAPRELLNALGKPQRVESRLWLTAAENQSIAAQRARAMEIDTPHPLVPEQVPKHEGPEGAGSLKNAISDALRPLGYRYRSKISGSGSGCLSRRTGNHHEIVVEYDWGPNSREVVASLNVCGAWFREVARLHVAAPNLFHACVMCPEAVAAVARNLAVSVAALETEWVPQVEAIYGPGPAWYKGNQEPRLMPYERVW